MDELKRVEWRQKKRDSESQSKRKRKKEREEKAINSFSILINCSLLSLSSHLSRSLSHLLKFHTQQEIILACGYFLPLSRFTFTLTRTLSRLDSHMIVEYYTSIQHSTTDVCKCIMVNRSTYTKTYIYITHKLFSVEERVRVNVRVLSSLEIQYLSHNV